MQSAILNLRKEHSKLIYTAIQTPLPSGSGTKFLMRVFYLNGEIYLPVCAHWRIVDLYLSVSERLNLPFQSIQLYSPEYGKILDPTQDISDYAFDNNHELFVLTL